MLLKHQITIGWPRDEALFLFTPKGEEEWVEGWSPDYVFPDTGETVQGMFFTTDHGNEKTYWACLEWKPDEGFVKYLRLNPDSRVSFVSVQLTALSEMETSVEVIYQVVPLANDAATLPGIPTPEEFVAYVEGWKKHIDALPMGSQS
ncbi:MAG: hypothetical protein QNJ35_16190 [Paracoccaceae bacterium]|nr:hypothetical protein [Paracoccaceae bacterium]